MLQVLAAKFRAVAFLSGTALSGYDDTGQQDSGYKYSERFFQQRRD